MIERIALRMAVVLISAALITVAASGQNAPAVAGSTVTIGGAVPKTLLISLADLEKMPQTTLPVVNPHSHKSEVYRGVPLDVLLQEAGVPHGEEIRGKWMAAYVLATAADGYRVVYSLAELDPGFLDSDVLVADEMNGAPLAANEGPFKLVAPHDKRPARWIRMLKSIMVVQAHDQ